MWTYTDDGMTLVDLSAMECLTIKEEHRKYVLRAWPYNSEDYAYKIGVYDSYGEAKEALDELRDGLNAGWTD